MTNNDLREKLAALQHEIWSDWMRWVIKVGNFDADGNLEIPMPFVRGWQRQIDTSYANLDKVEQDSDRREADRILELLNENLIRHS